MHTGGRGLPGPRLAPPRRGSHLHGRQGVGGGGGGQEGAEAQDQGCPCQAAGGGGPGQAHGGPSSAAGRVAARGRWTHGPGRAGRTDGGPGAPGGLRRHGRPTCPGPSGQARPAGLQRQLRKWEWGGRRGGDRERWERRRRPGGRRAGATGKRNRLGRRAARRGAAARREGAAGKAREEGPRAGTRTPPALLATPRVTRTPALQARPGRWTERPPGP